MLSAKLKLPLLLSTVLLALAALHSETRSAENFMLSFGKPEGERADIVFSANKMSKRAILIKTTRVGVAGSRLFLEIDKSRTPIVNHIFTDDECRFSDNGSACEITISGTSNEYQKILYAFRRGRTLHIGIVGAGSMKMSEDVSLIGFTAYYKKL